MRTPGVDAWADLSVLALRVCVVADLVVSSVGCAVVVRTVLVTRRTESLVSLLDVL